MRISDWSSDVCSSDLQLTYMLAGLVAPSSGALRIGGRDVERLPSAVTGRRIAYVGANAYHFVGSLRDNLLYGLKHRPLRPPASEQALSPAALAEARRAGNPEFDIHADWVDYAAAGATGADDITEHPIEMPAVVALKEIGRAHVCTQVTNAHHV